MIEVTLFGFRQPGNSTPSAELAARYLPFTANLSTAPTSWWACRTRDALNPLPSKRTDPSTDSPAIHTCRSSNRTSRSGTSRHRGSTTVSSSDRYPATVLAARLALVDSQRSAINPNVTPDSFGSVHVPVTCSETIVLSQFCASALRPNALVCSRPVSST